MRNNFWELVGLDTEDLAVAVAGDFCEGKIDPTLYLSERENMEKLNYVRWSLALGMKYESLSKKGFEEIKSIYEAECIKRFGDSVPCVMKKQIVLGTLFQHFGAGICGKYVIKKDSFRGNYPEDKDILIKKLKAHFCVENFTTRRHFYKEAENELLQKGLKRA